MKRRGMHFIPYDYESAFDKSIEDINESFVEYLLKTKYRCVYSCTITVSSQMTLLYGGVTYVLDIGKNVLYDVILKPEINTLILTGNGKVDISYTGGIL